MNYNDYSDETNPVVTMTVKGYGTIKIELFPKLASNTVNNMIDLINKGFYNGLTFHRVIEGFMIQGGAGEDTKCKIKGEFKSNGVANDLVHSPGVISMARTADPNSATSQFFIMHKASPHLDGAYAGFGVVIEGMEVVEKIATTKTDHQDAPREQVVMESVDVDTKGINYDKPNCL